MEYCFYSLKGKEMDTVLKTTHFSFLTRSKYDTMTF